MQRRLEQIFTCILEWGKGLVNNQDHTRPSLHNLSCACYSIKILLETYECGTAQPSPCIAGDNVLKIIMPEPLPEARALTNEAPRKLDTE